MVSVDEVIEEALTEKASDIEREIDRDFMAYCGPIVFGGDSMMRDCLEGRVSKRPGLTVLLDTTGGIVEVVERMADTIRHHYRDVQYLVLDRAMSAGTVWALSGDSIVMDYFAVLGPIDPQVMKGNRLVPALAYLIQLDDLRERDRNGNITAVDIELASKLDLAELEIFKQAQNLSISLLKKWLVNFKFKDWTHTQSRRQIVTQQMKEERAEAIAKCLSDPTRWHSHSRGIPRKGLESDDIKLAIDHLEDNERFASLAKTYGRLLTDHRDREDSSMEPTIHFPRG